MYGQNSFGTSDFGTDTVGHDGGESNKLDLSKYLPDWMRFGKNVLKLVDIFANQIGATGAYIVDTRKQRAIDSATWGLIDWERDLGLPSDSALGDDRRREIIKAKLLGAGTTTKQMIVQTAAAFSGGDVEVVEHSAENRFEVVFIGVKGIPPNMAAFIRMLEDIKPAHLAYSFRYTYTVWGDLLHMTWGEAMSKTWGELRVYEEE
ncbi:putative phage tail protein [Paenibacillus sp. strain BS8-2]